jgi:hypothetical protein
MKRTFKLYLLPVVSLLSLTANAQTTTWKLEQTDDGKILVTSKVSERTEASGNQVPLIEYNARTTDFMNIQVCIDILKDPSKHNKFLDVKVNKLIKTYSSTEWLYYYVFNAPWPFTPADCVVKVNYSKDIQTKTTYFTLTAAPDLLETTKMNRFTNYTVVYALKELGNGKIEVTVKAKMTPPVPVPLWMLRASFPDSAADPLRKYITLVKSN